MATQPLAPERKKQFLMNASSLEIHIKALGQIAQDIVCEEDGGNLGVWIEQEARYRQAESEIAAIEGIVPGMIRMLNSIWAARNLAFGNATGVTPYQAWNESLLAEEEIAS